MLEDISHKCGIVAVYDLTPGINSNFSSLVPEFLLDLQHRGQLAAGMTTYHPARNRLIYTFKNT